MRGGRGWSPRLRRPGNPLGSVQDRLYLLWPEFSFNPLWPLLGGFIINGISAFIGVGGGFLYVPFLTSVAGLPMFIVAGTSALAVLVGMIVNIFNMMVVQHVPVDFVVIGTELIGIAIGSVLGPVTSKKIPDIWLKRIFVVLAVYVGICYSRASWGIQFSRACSPTRDLAGAATSPPGVWQTMQMHPVYLALDPFLIFCYRLTGQAGVNFVLGTLVLAMLALLVGECSAYLAARLVRPHFARISGEAAKYQDLSMEALKVGTGPLMRPPTSSPMTPSASLFSCS